MSELVKYFSIGSMSEKEGLTFVRNIYDEEGNLLTGRPENQMYKGKEISESQYYEYVKIRNGSDVLGTAGGIINEVGKKALEDHWIEQQEKWKEVNESRIALVVKKIKKQLELGIISSEDIDTEIMLNNMTEFADEIKKRLEQ